MDTNIQEQGKEEKNEVTTRYRNEILARLITDKFKTISAFAYSLGYTRSYVSQIVNGFREPTIKEKIKIAKGLGVDSLTIWQDKKNEQIK